MTAVFGALDAMDRAELVSLWEQKFGRPPPSHTHASFMRYALAWALQGGRVPSVVSGAAKKVTFPANPMSPGTQLIREWQGQTYRVQVTESGFLYAGKTWRSLSVIAREITGTARSGPAFFGVGS